MLPHSLFQSSENPTAMKGGKTLLDLGQVGLGKELNAGEKVKGWEKELNTAKGGGSERASSSGAGVKRSTAPRASADMQNV